MPRINKSFTSIGLIAGIVLLLSSFLPYLLGKIVYSGAVALFFCALFYLGIIFIADFITKKLGKFSILSLLLNPRFIFFAICLGTLLQFVVADIGGIWYFPYWSKIDYLLIGDVFGGWAFYIGFLIITYEAIKLLLDKYIPQKKLVTSYRNYEKLIYRGFLYIGIALVGIFIFAVLRSTHLFAQYSWIVNEPKVAYLTWPYIVMFALGAFMIAEHVDYIRHQTSLTKDTLHGYLSPILSLIVIAFTVALFNEIQNLSIHVWSYANYPPPNLFQLPVNIILVAWPLHIAVVIAMWRAFGPKASAIIFANSKNHLQPRKE